jgi:phenylacetate-CoA ligase
MNPFLNPYFLSKAIKSYLVDRDRIWRMDNVSLKKFRDKRLQKILKYAYTIPMYHEIYKKAGIHPNDISGIDDIAKLPFITKNDIRKNFPDKIVPPTFDKKGKTIISYTSGTTGEPISLFFDMYTIVKGLLGYIRVIKEHNVDWRKTKMTVLVDLTENSVERNYLTDGIIPILKPLFSFDNMQIFNTYGDAEELIKEINSFQPEFLGGYPGMLRQLAILKEKGCGDNIQPRCIISSGAVLDIFLKKYLEETFGTQVFDAYGSMESGPAAFQCKNGGYHIHSDLVHLEIIDDEGEPVSPGEPGKVVVTRLYGRGTPIIRYTGLDDIITSSDGNCNCGIAGGLISEVHGRENQSIILPGGRVLLPSSIAMFFGELSEKINITKLKRSQIIQHKLNKFEIIALVDHDLRGKKPSVEKIFSTIKEDFRKKFGSDIDIDIRETDYFEDHIPGIVSKIDKSQIKNKIYIKN